MKHTLYAHARRYLARRKPGERHILTDVVFILMSVLIAVILASTHAITRFITATSGLELLGTFVAGMFFTSIFTTAPAMATLGEIALSQSVYVTAFVGAIGSVLGDLLIFKFVRDRVAADILELLQEEGILRRARKIFKFKHFRWFTLLAGVLLIASPLPDELGITLLGFSHVNARYFVMLSYVFNFLGILGIGFTARAIAGI
ncbi:hypothetical protein HYW60_02620 [Candidatus Kaiserbacteria bacterium]|nr:hypothetical protein [Candidatus Kaiserbacteria bacterium]